MVTVLTVSVLIRWKIGYWQLRLHPDILLADSLSQSRLISNYYLLVA